MSKFNEVRRMNKRQLVYQALNFAMIICSALMIWKGCMVLSGCENPIIVVLSSSEEYAFYRGDLLFVTNYEQEPIRVGEVVVFKIEGWDIPIVHRIIKLHERKNGSVKFVTKGDNNQVDDRGLYAPGQMWLERKDIIGRVRGYVPYVGIITILMNDNLIFKYTVLVMLTVYVWLEPKDVIGRARGYVPYVGIITILMNDNPIFKYTVLVMLAAIMLLRRKS